jgi:hypothetical protein
MVLGTARCAFAWLAGDLAIRGGFLLAVPWWCGLSLVVLRCPPMGRLWLVERHASNIGAPWPAAAGRCPYMCPVGGCGGGCLGQVLGGAGESRRSFAG